MAFRRTILSLTTGPVTMWRHRPDRAVADALRLLAVAGLMAAQVVAAGRCAACDPGACAACVAGTGADAATAHAAAAGTAACPLCAAAAPGGCHAADGRAAATDHDAAPCECQWEPRDDEPLVPPSRPVVDLAAAGPWPAPAPADERTAALVARLPDLSDIPQRPVRILLGVWRN
jgi:hypothetical protein